MLQLGAKIALERFNSVVGSDIVKISWLIGGLPGETERRGEGG